MVKAIARKRKNTLDTGKRVVILWYTRVFLLNRTCVSKRASVATAVQGSQAKQHPLALLGAGCTSRQRERRGQRVYTPQTFTPSSGREAWTKDGSRFYERPLDQVCHLEAQCIDKKEHHDYVQRGESNVTSYEPTFRHSSRR